MFAPFKISWMTLTIKNPLWAWAWCLHMSHEDGIFALQVGPVVVEVVTDGNP